MRDGGSEVAPQTPGTWSGWARFPYADPGWVKLAAKFVAITWLVVLVFALLIGALTRYSMEIMLRFALASFNPIITYLLSPTPSYWDIAWPGMYLPISLSIQATFLATLYFSRFTFAKVISFLMLICFAVKRWYGCGWVLLDLFLN
jgi:hypothetical protein